MFDNNVVSLFPKVNWKNGLWYSTAPLCSRTHQPTSFLKWNVSVTAELKTPPMTMVQRIMQVSWLPTGTQAKERKLMHHPAMQR